MAKDSIFQRTVAYFKGPFLDKFRSDETILENQFKAFIANAETIQNSITDSIIGMRELEATRNEDAEKLTRLNITVENLVQQLRNNPVNDPNAKARLNTAITQQTDLEYKISQTDAVISQQQKTVDELKKELAVLEQKKNEITLKRDSLQNRSKSADAMLEIQNTLSSTNLSGLSTKLDTMERDVREREYTVRARKELNESSPENVYRELAALEAENAVEAQANALTARTAESAGSNVISLSSRRPVA